MIIIDIETTGLNSMKDKITCISCLNSLNGDITSFYGPDENDILTLFWNRYINNLELISFNGDGFDIPFLIKRSLINKVKMKKIEKTIDLRKIVNGFFFSYDKYAKGTLDDWTQVLGLECKKTNGLEVITAAKEGDYELIKEHCEDDVKITYELWKRCTECGLI